jgi:hypothetical protein
MIINVRGKRKTPLTKKDFLLKGFWKMFSEKDYTTYKCNKCWIDHDGFEYQEVFCKEHAAMEAEQDKFFDALNKAWNILEGLEGENALIILSDGVRLCNQPNNTWDVNKGDGWEAVKADDFLATKFVAGVEITKVDVIDYCDV